MMSKDDYPRVYAFLLERSTEWVWIPSNLPIEERIEEVMGKTHWGVLKEFESILTDYETMKSLLIMASITPAEKESRQENLRRCPFDQSRGCNQGKTAYIRNVKGEGREQVEQTELVCAAWSSGRCCRLPKASPDYRNNTPIVPKPISEKWR